MAFVVWWLDQRLMPRVQIFYVGLFGAVGCIARYLVSGWTYALVGRGAQHRQRLLGRALAVEAQQLERPGEPAWDSPFGRGRPGWHIECSAIALDHLDAPLDVQGGGSDLAFPHHEMGAAEAQVASGTWPYARHYTHAGMVRLDGEKMSKSRGNLVFVSALRHAGTDPMAIRLSLLAHHYRTEWAWTDQGLAGAESRLALWRAAMAGGVGPEAAPAVDRMRAALADDLRTPDVLDAVDAWSMAQQAGTGTDPHAPGAMRDAVDALLGVRV